MAKKISQLTQATEVKSDDVTVIVQDGETKKLPLNMMVTKQDIENKKIAGLAKLDEIEATYENDTYTPTITVKNKSSVKTGEGDEVDYSANVMDGHAKSAILKGQTLINLSPFTKNNGVYELNVSTHTTSHVLPVRLQQNKRYIFIFKLTNSQSSENSNYIMCRGLLTDGAFREFGRKIQTFSNGKHWFMLSSSEGDIDSIFVGANFDVTLSDTLIIEYQDGMENWDIPYFTGMQSVKLPVLTTTGKNLANTTIASGLMYYDSGRVYQSDLYYVTDFIKIPSNTVYSFNMGQDQRYCLFDSNKKYITGLNAKTFNSGDASFVRFSGRSSEVMMIEGSTHPTSYEPFKSNILTVNEPIELRGSGDVKDELNLLTGELTQRIGEIVLDGSVMDNTILRKNDSSFLMIRFDKIGFKKINGTTDIISSKLRNAEYYSSKPFNTGDVVSDAVGWGFGVCFANNETATKDEATAYLNNLKPVIQGYLETPVVKTVDLMPSGTHPSTTPYCWKNGHIQLSSSGLLPNLEYSVVTSRAGQINQNATMIVKNDKRIFDLEILLAGGLVNTTYQALTLQNQVETGLSKASLNSETEPDYLLYHMIMKLIEEKAYKLDDLTEKVSVFYLYEKLSDEQFETIYSALYPFAEDEIIEEPVVEELPEVVEDEVIM